MSNQGWILTKHSFTFTAFIGFLFGMDSLMLNKISHLTKTFSTVVTFIWLFLRVNLLMDTQNGLLFEGLPTDVTFKGILRSVNSLMSNKICLPPEGSSTFSALVRYCICQDLLTSQEQWPLVEGCSIIIKSALPLLSLGILILNKVKVLKEVLIVLITNNRECQPVNVHKFIKFM